MSEILLLSLVGPALLIVVSSIALYQFNTLWSLFAVAVRAPGKTEAWKAVQPALRQLNLILEKSIGATPSTLKTNLTHVLMVSVVLSILVAGERVRAAQRAVKR